MAPADQPHLDPDLVDAVRGAYVRPVDEATASRHVSAIVAAASAGGESLARRSRQRWRGWRPVVAAAGAALLLPVGLAVAGVNLPHAIEGPYRAIGIHPPHRAHHEPAPATPAAAPRTTPGSVTPRRPAEQRARHAQAGQGHRHHGKRHANPVGRAGRENNRRGPRARPVPSPALHAKKHGPGSRRSTGLQHRPVSPKPRATPKGRTPPRTRRTDKAPPK
jgi:hypothetical protein